MSVENSSVPSNVQAPSPEVSETSETSLSATPSVEGVVENKEASPSKQEIKNLKKQLKLKIDGKELVEEFDPNDDTYLTQQLQLAKVAQKRMQEKATLEKQVDYFMEELRKNPKKILSNPNIGIDIKKLAAEIIEEEIANSQKSPEQLKAEQLENELKAIKEEREREKTEFQKKELERLQEQAYERYDLQMTKALESSDLPKSPYIVKKMAEYMILGVQNGLDVTPEDVLPLVKSEISSDLKQMFAVMPDEVIENIVGKEVFTRIRKKNVAKAKTSAPPAPVKSQIKDTGQSSANNKPKEAQKKTFREFFGA